jgi:DNA-binding CsgD family transcriptional regulator
MERLRNEELSRLREYLQEVSVLCDLDGFPGVAIRALQKLVPADIISYNEIDPQTSKVFTVADPPYYESLPDIHGEFEHLMRDHPLIRHYYETRDGHALKISDFLSQSQFHDLGLYGFYRQVDVEYQMAVTLPSSPTLVIGLALNRGAIDFDERERILLNLVRQHLIQAHANAEAWTLTGQALEAEGVAIVLLSAEGSPRFVSEYAGELLRKYFEEPGCQGGLPQPVSAWVLGQVSRFRVESDPPPLATPFVVRREGRGSLTLRFVFGDATRQQALVLLREQVEVSVASLFPLGLTRRESEILYLAVQGKTDDAIATALTLSRRTVEKHMEHIRLKLGVTTRTAAVAMALQSSSR